ncbi:uncharacterized protein LOC109541765 isoform X1 [Dendroctonus ponderosae]|uniref:uncharacterized protein LOC109541765 isoform X1 n=1 Tax=Dendroctonus ponderosae TaxID=77166 RepID=UPI0020361AFB|nr:uncharacterized protein LOC109541765 isoform X1 [Dendroctonus ponderosae]
MSSKKHDLEIVYSLRWKNRTKREESKEMSVVVVVYDIPSTTLNFETFKNYLLKNSGTPEDDVRVYFIMDNGKEYLIQSQTDFQVALYAFRRKARAGEMINLLLERVSEQPTHKNLRHSNDVETQFDNVDATSILSTCCNADTAPEWFIAGLAQLKKEIKDEITSNVSTLIASAVAEIKSPCLAPVPAQHASCSNRARAKPYKWSKKLTPQLVENITDTKVLLKSLKLENKLDKLERKASKYREKRHALQHGQKSSDNAPKSSDSEAGPSKSNSRSIGKEIKRKLEEHQRKQEEPIAHQQSDEPKMGARPVSRQRSVPHMVGGEIYLHQWEVQNTGEAQWTLMTQLQYTWGSKKLIPLSQYITVPHLKPGEIGTISIRLHIPTHPGIYECYWQFLHKGRRFGDWLDVQVIVDPFDLKGHSSVLEHSGPQACHFINPSELQENVGKISESDQILLQAGLFVQTPGYKSLQDQDTIDRFKVLHQMGKMSLEDEAKSELLNRLIKEDDVDSDCSWNSERAHVDEFVLMPPVPQSFVLDSPDTTKTQAKTPAKQVNAESSAVTSDLKTNKAGSSESFDDNNNTDCVSRSSVNSIKFRDEELDNIVVITLPKDEQVKEGFIYVHVDGQKVLVPKNILKSEIISAAQEFNNYRSGSSSAGIVIDASETLNKSPTPSLASTIINQDTEVNGANKPKQENLISAESLELFCDMQEYPSCAQQAVDLTVGPKDTFDTSTIDEALDRSSYFEANNFMSHCSAAGSCFSEFNTNAERQTRMFVFPQDVPGYEVIYPTLDINPEEATLTTDSCVAPKPNQPASVLAQEAISHPLEAVPNYQQTPVELRRSPVQSPQATVRETEPAASTHPLQEPIPELTAQHRPNADNGWVSASRPHILPEGLVSGAVSAARSVMNMIRPQSPGRWVNGHWVSSSPETPREANLQALAEMGFWNRDLNATLLARYSDDLNRVVAELVQ